MLKHMKNTGPANISIKIKIFFKLVSVYKIYWYGFSWWYDSYRMSLEKLCKLIIILCFNDVTTRNIGIHPDEYKK